MSECVIVIAAAFLREYVLSDDLAPVFATRPFQVMIVSSSACVANVCNSLIEDGVSTR